MAHRNCGADASRAAGLGSGTWHDWHVCIGVPTGQTARMRPKPRLMIRESQQQAEVSLRARPITCLGVTRARSHQEIHPNRAAFAARWRSTAQRSGGCDSWMPTQYSTSAVVGHRGTQLRSVPDAHPGRIPVPPRRRSGGLRRQHPGREAGARLETIDEVRDTLLPLSYMFAGHRQQEWTRRWAAQMADLARRHCGSGTKIGIERACAGVREALESEGFHAADAAPVLAHARKIKPPRKSSP